MAKSRGTKRGRKKKRIAVHIKEAQKKRSASALSSDDVKTTKLVATPVIGGKLRPGKRPRGSESLEVADPARREKERAGREKERADASHYLSAWLSARNAKQNVAKGDDSVFTDVWKFNKKAQAWLLRHMFIEDELAEDSFRTMCLYLEGLKGAARQRVLAEAQQIIDKYGPNEVDEQASALPDSPGKGRSDEGRATATSSSATNSSRAKRREKNAKPVKKKVRFEGDSSDSESMDSTDTMPQDGAATSSASSNSNSSDEENEEATPEITEKKREEVRSAKTKQAKAETKARASKVAYERALQAAEVLS